MKKEKKVNALLGKTIKEIVGCNKSSDCIHFIMSDGTEYEMYHEQDCCESVSIDDIEGDVEDLIGSTLLQAEESTNSGSNSEYYGSFTWTFYKFATIKGYVTIKWYGESNGCYSEAVYFCQMK